MVINAEKHKEYWKDRSAREGAKTVGFGGLNEQAFIQRTQEWINRFQPYWKAYLSGKVLDYGCGIGRFTKHLAPDAVGVDLTENLLGIARVNNPETLFFHMNDPEKLPFDDNSFDSVWTSTVLQHLVYPGLVQKIVGEIRRVLKPKGNVLFYENTAFDRKAGHIEFRSKEKYRDLFLSSGFTKVVPLKSFTEDGNEEHTLFFSE